MSYRRKTFLGIIPARAGSKGLPGKNTRRLCGKPLIAWSVQAGLKSKYLDEVVVTTDSPKIRCVALRHGAHAPFLRPRSLATDTAPTFGALRHAIDFYEKKGRRFDYVVLLEPTSPLREVSDIDGPIRRLLDRPTARAIVSVCRSESAHPAFLARKDRAGFLRGYRSKRMSEARRQDIDDVYFPDGTIYVSETRTLLREKTFYHERTLGYEVPKWKSPEVDDLHDFVVVEALMKHRKRKR